MALLVGLVKTTCWLIGLLPFNHYGAGRVWDHIITAVGMPNSWLLYVFTGQVSMSCFRHAGTVRLSVCERVCVCVCEI